MKRVSNTFRELGCAAVLLCCGGCLGIKAEFGTTHNHFQDDKTAKTAVTPAKSTAAVKKASQETTVAVKKESKVVVITDHRDRMRLQFTAGGRTADEKTLAEKIIAGAQGKLAVKDAVIGQKGTQDLLLMVTPELVTVDKDANYYRMNCTVQLTVKSASTGRIFAGKSLALPSKRRILGKAAAVTQFVPAATSGLTEWGAAELKRITEQELAVSVLALQIEGNMEAASIQQIGKKIGAMKQVVSYELAEQDNAQGICRYRVVYFKSAYPNGLGNAVTAATNTTINHK